MDRFQEAEEALREADGNVSEAARALGISRSTMQSRLAAAAKRKKQGEAPDRLPGAKGDISKKQGKGWLELTDYSMPTEGEVLDKHNLDPAIWEVVRVVPNQWQGYYKRGPAGEETHEVVTLYSLRLYVERRVPVAVADVAERLASRIKPLPKPTRLRRRSSKAEGQLGVFGLYDAHLGALCWDGDTDQNNDTQIAVDRCVKAIDDGFHAMRPHPLRKLLVPLGNDFIHFDNERGETSSGRVMVDYDSRYGRVIEAAHDVLAHLGDRCLEVCDDVEFVLVGGNHDRIAALHLAHWMKQRYRNDRRVAVDVTQHPRKYRSWGSVLLGFTHGDRLSIRDVYRHMAEEAREAWAVATCREMHGGDKHNRKDVDLTVTDSYGRVTYRQNPSLAPRDAWTVREGFDAVRAMDVYRYSPKGFVGMDTVYP